ncbi:MAG TPA: hypothetical protein VJM48_11325 [Methylibium sp.]|jgi:hypothetical protein|nr:hypothetical protein [Methylibium sp.]
MRTPKRSLQVLWPAFLMAGVMEMLVFAFVDPQAVHGVLESGLPRAGVYTIAFFAFWAVIATAGAMTALLISRRRN